MSEDQKPPGEASAQPAARFLSHMGMVGQWILPASAALYVLGFLVVGAYLAKFGIAPLEMWRPRYLAAGALCAVVSVGPVTAGIWAARETVAEWRRPRSIGVRLLTIALTLVLVGGIDLCWGMWVLPTVTDPPKGSWEVALLIGISLQAGVFSQMLLEKLRDRGWELLHDPLTFMIALAAVLSVVRAGAQVYGRTPPSWGGAKPGRVYMILREGTAESARALGIGLSVSRGATVTHPMWLIDESERGYIASADRGEPKQAIWIPRDLIAGVAYERPGHRFAKPGSSSDRRPVEREGPPAQGKR